MLPYEDGVVVAVWHVDVNVVMNRTVVMIQL